MFVIMGATGRVGGAALAALRARGVPVRAVARDPSGAARPGVEIARADASDEASLVAAFAGAEAAFVMLVPPPGATDVLAESRVLAGNIGAAVRASGVRHVVALSAIGAHLAEGTGIVRALHDFEVAVAAGAPSLVLLRPGNFMENWIAMLPVARDAGVLPSGLLPLDRKSEVVSAVDVGRVAAELLFDPAPGTRIVNLLGPVEYSACDAAAAVSKLLGRQIPAVPSSRQESIEGMRAAGLGVDYAEKLADLNDAINAGRLYLPQDDGELRRGTIGMEEALAAS